VSWGLSEGGFRLTDDKTLVFYGGISLENRGGFASIRTRPSDLNLDSYPAGQLKMYLPPWDDKSNTRVWPNVIPLPEGYPARYIALMMDRLNFPGMTGSNLTYGAMYLYHAHPVNDQQDYEYK